ncbi:MAG: hypothetical protein U5L96_11525 [Owenweeksia sp.]|nr:hypothetical protein [Owenweeksia sp.]
MLITTRIKKWKSFEYIYREFDSTGIFDYNYPVMLAEYGSLEKQGRQANWFCGIL